MYALKSKCDMELFWKHLPWGEPQGISSLATLKALLRGQVTASVWLKVLQVQQKEESKQSVKCDMLGCGVTNMALRRMTWEVQLRKPTPKKQQGLTDP